MHPKSDLRAARSSVAEHVPTEMTFSELVSAYCAVRFDGADLRMRKWVNGFGDESAWAISAEEIQACTARMLADGFKPSTVNRGISQMGSIYRWAIHERRLPAKGFRSPTLAIRRHEASPSPRWSVRPAVALQKPAEAHGVESVSH